MKVIERVEAFLQADQSYRDSDKKLLRDSGGKFVKGHPPLLVGKDHWKWAGDDVKYDGVHKWIKRVLGKPDKCQDCGDTSQRKYEWANISRKYYRDASDWKSLCRPCHHKFDSISDKIWATRRSNGTDKGYTLEKKTHCKRGHEYNKLNTYYYKETPFCRICRNYREKTYANNR
jgi:hypothetical protein